MQNVVNAYWFVWIFAFILIVIAFNLIKFPTRAFALLQKIVYGLFGYVFVYNIFEYILVTLRTLAYQRGFF